MKTFLIGLSWKSKTRTAIYAVFITVSLLGVNSAFAQSFIDTTKVWSLVSMDTGGGPYQGNLTTTHFKFAGDTLINSEVYNILYFSRDADQQNWRIDSFWKEKHDSIFRFNTIREREDLIYDFNLTENDTFLNVLYVDSVKVKEWGGKMRKHWYFHKLNSTLNDITIWIEGVGNINAFIRSSDIGIAGAITWLLCFTENGELVYQNSEYHSCSINTSVRTIKKHFELIKVYSNGEKTIIVNPVRRKSGIIDIYNITGQKIVQQEIPLTEFKIKLPSKGVYIYRFITKMKELQTGKMVVK